MKIGITGCKGFIGSHLLTRLVSENQHHVRVIVRTTPLSLPRALGVVEVVQGDLGSLQSCEGFVRGLDVIFHLAHCNTPSTSDIDLPGDACLNLLPLLNLIQAIRNAQTRPHLVYFSSGGAVYGRRSNRVPFKEIDPCNPISSYGIQKMAAEHYLRLGASKRFLTATILRVGNAYGTLLPATRRQGLIGVAINNLIHDRPVGIFGDPDNVRDYVHVDDICDVCCKVVHPPEEFSVYNVATGIGHSVRSVLELIEDCLGVGVSHRKADNSVDAQWFPDWVVLDITKAERELGWCPKILLNEGVQRMVTESRREGLRSRGGVQS